MSNNTNLPTNLTCCGIPASFKPKKAQSIPSPVGDRYIHKVDLSFDSKGKKIAKVGAKLDFDAYIQASLPSTDIAAIVAKAKMGDESVLNVHSNGFVGDSTVLPKDIYDYKKMNDLYDKVSGSFNNLPKDVQALFNNDANEYLNQILNNTALKTINDFKASHEKEKEKAAEETPAAEGGN